MADYTGTTDRDFVLASDAGADVFYFTPATLAKDDLIHAGNGPAIDTLDVLLPGRISGDQLHGVRGIETVRLADGGTNWISLIDDFVASAYNQHVSVFGGSGSDTVYLAYIKAGRSVDITPGYGNDYLIGGASNDTFRFNTDALNAYDRVNGGSGSDTLMFLTPGTVAPSALTTVRNIDTITLATGGISIAFDTYFYARNPGNLTIVGSNGNDHIDASALSNATIQANDGADWILGGNGATFIFDPAQLTAADTIIAQSTHDTLKLSAPGTIDAASFANVSGIDTIATSNAGLTTITLTEALVHSAGSIIAANGALALGIIAYGPASIDASLVTGFHSDIAVNLYSNGSTFVGGLGADLVGGSQNVISGSHITGGGGSAYDELTVTGVYPDTQQVVDLSGVSGFESIKVSGNSLVYITDTQAASAYNHLLRVISSTDPSVIDASAVTAGNSISFSGKFGTGVANNTFIGGAGNDIFSSGNGAVTMIGGAGDDTLKLTGNENDRLPDTMTGGAGADAFYYPAVPEVVTITDFSGISGGEHDTLNFSAYANSDGDFSSVLDAWPTGDYIAGVDLLRIHNMTIDNAADLAKFWAGHGGFAHAVLVENSAGHTILYFAGTVTDFGTVSMNMIQPGDFHFAG